MKFIERFSRKSGQQPRPADPGQAPLLMALEPRIMFDASVGVVAQDAAAQTTVDAAKDSTSSNERAKTQSLAATADAGSKHTSQRQEVVFVDGQVSDTAQLLAGLTGNAEVVILDPSKDGLQQMADYLKGREGLDAIHVLSHGADGTVQMGNVWLASNNLAEHHEALVSIGAVLKADGDLMLYGCNVGEGAKGQAFLDQLAAITGADVAASTDSTGAAALGGNWTLERSSGVIETAALSVSGYDGLMVQSFTGGANGTAPVLGGVNSLQRAVVGDFNNDGRADILWQGAGTGGPWSLSLGNANGSFTVVSQALSPFAGVTLLDAVTSGVNYHAADFDGDGDIDLVAAATSGGQVMLYRNNGSSFMAEDITGGFGPAFGVRSVTGDFNADGYVDLLYQVDSVVGAPWRVKLNNGNGTFVDVLSTDNRSPFKNVYLPDFVAYNYKVADFDGDGDSDLMYVTPSVQIVYLRNDNGAFSTVPGNLNLPTPMVNRVVVGDFDGDGDVDVLYQSGGNGTAWRYARNDGVTFSDIDIASSPFAGVSLADMPNQQYRVGDFDGDGDLDIFVSSASISSVYFQGGSIPIRVNDAPTLTVSGGTQTWTEGNTTTSTPVAIDNAVTISDADGPYIASATVRISNNYSNGNDYLELVSNPATMGNIIGTWDAANGALTLTSAGNQASLAQFQAALRAVTFTNLSESPTPGARTVQFQVNDGSLDSAGVIRSITMITVDDAPVISAPASTLVVEDVASVINQISISDPDSINIDMTLNVGSGTLAATSGAGVVVSGISTAIKLSGTIDAVNAFIANNRLTYTTAANATADVTLTIAVDNGSVGTDTKTMTLRVSPVNDAPVVTVPVSITVPEDLAASLSGISFSDVDAGSASVTATFSVPSGTLSAISGSGVTVTDSGTATLTLSGSLSDINAFIAALSVKYQTALDNTSSVLLTVSINDNGNTGGSAQTDSKTVIINVNAVNDAPVNSVPAAQSTSQDVVLAFNSVKGNAISISDVDAGTSLMTVTLSSMNGTMTLSNTSGVMLLNGTGANDTSILLQGTLANLNTVLQSLAFKPTNGFLGSAQLTIESNDQGNTGSGGAKSSMDTIAISVLAANPKVTSVSAQGLDRTVKVGDEVLVNMVFDQAILVDLTGGIPSLLLETGLLDRNAVYQSGSGSNTLVFKYTVQAGDFSADLDFQSTAGLQLNGARLINSTADLAILTLPTVGGADALGGRSNIVVDGVAPVVASVTSPSDGTYIAGQNLDFTVNFSERVVVSTISGTPRIAVTLDTGGTVYADYVSGSGGSALVFRLTVANGQLDSNGITLGSAVQLNGGSISDVAGNDTVVSLNSVGSTANINVDGVAPAVVSVVAPGDGSYKAGDVLTFTVNASEGVVVNTSNGTPRLVLTVGGVTRYASYISGAAGGALLFQYTVQADDASAGGLVVGNTLDLNGGSVRDPAGNALNLNLNGLSNAGNVLIDTTLPTASSLVRVDASSSNSGSVSYTLTFNENVSGVDASDFNLVFTGTASGSIASVTRVDGRTYTILIDAIGGAGSLRLDLNASGTGIVDAAGNPITGGLQGASYSIDRVAPSVVSVDVPAAGTYVAGQNLDFTVHLDEAVQLSVANGTPRIEVRLDNGTTAYATYLSGAGTNALVFRLTVANGQLDTNGITLGSAIQLNGATLRDSVGNNINVGLNGVDDTHQVRVDAVVPTVTTVGLPVPGAYNAGDVLRFTINTSESVIVDTSTGTPRVALNIGGLIRYATYVSGTGSNALVFEYTVESGNNAAGIGLAGTLDLNGGTVRDAAGNALNQGLNTQGGAGGVIVDTEAPQVSNIVRVDLSPTNRSSVRYTVTFNEDVNGVDSADFSLAFTGSASGRIASVEQVNGRTYTIVVDNLAGAGNVRLDLSASGTGIVDVAGNPITGGLQGAVYSLGRVAPSVSSVDVPANGTYVAGQHLDFTVRTSETVRVDSGDGNPRLAITLDNGRVVYADYVSGSGGNALLFRLNVTGGMSGNSTFNVGSAIDFNGGSIRDAQGNDAQAGLRNVADTRGILLDAKAPQPSSIVVDGPVQPSDRTLNFTLTFDEAVSGVDAGDFGVVGTGNASGSVQSVLQIDAKTYRITVSNISGAGALALSLNALGSGIRDQVGNELAVSLIGQSQTIQSQDVGDLSYRLTPPQTSNAPSTVALQPQVPGFLATDAVSPLVSPGLFEVRTVGGNMQPLGTIFLGNGSSAPSFIAQVFASGDGNLGGSQGGFGGGEGSVFGSSTFAGIFSREIPGVSEMNVFNGSQWERSGLNQELRGVFGAPTLGQQLHHINEADQRQVRELATALAQPTQIGERA